MSKKILFICKENAGRSQMAEGFLRYFAPHLKVSSAGISPSNHINPTVIQVMNEVGIDISHQMPKCLTDQMTDSIIPVSMGCMVTDDMACQTGEAGTDIMEWAIPDPHGAGIEQVRKIRDQIRQCVVDLIKELDV